MALEGTLKDFSLADIFQLIGLQRKTGVLTLRTKDDTVTVTFLDGKVVGADSLNHRLENRLGNVLIKTGAITQEQLSGALAIQKETLQRLGFVLTHYGIISPDALKQAIQLQILQIVYRLFRWKDGDYHFSQETTIEYDRDNVVPITAESILMEGARMIDEWPIIEKRIRSYDMVFRKKASEREIAVSDEADEVDFDESPSPGRRKKPVVSDKVRISEEEKAVFDLVDGTHTVSDIVEMSRFSEFDTNKALYELLTRDLIEEVRGAAAQTAVEAPPVDDAEVAETPVPLPLVAVLAIVALLSIVTSFKNPLNALKPLATAPRGSSMVEAKKAISLQRIQHIGNAIDEYSSINGRVPGKLQDLVPYFVSAPTLVDPWGNAYKYLQQPTRYLVIGFTPDGRPDTDLFLAHTINGSAGTTVSKPMTGGIELLD